MSAASSAVAAEGRQLLHRCECPADRSERVIEFAAIDQVQCLLQRAQMFQLHSTA
jgi:hypothetical protein